MRENIDLIPDIAEQLEGNDINKKHLFMSGEEEVVLANIVVSFSLCRAKKKISERV